MRAAVRIVGIAFFSMVLLVLTPEPLLFDFFGFASSFSGRLKGFFCFWVVKVAVGEMGASQRISTGYFIFRFSSTTVRIL